jgi:hypothetical protein
MARFKCGDSPEARQACSDGMTLNDIHAEHDFLEVFNTYNSATRKDLQKGASVLLQPTIMKPLASGGSMKLIARCRDTNYFVHDLIAPAYAGKHHCQQSSARRM